MPLEDHFHWVTPTLAVGDFYSSTPPECWLHFSAILNLSESQHDGLSPEYNEYLWLPFSDGDGKAFQKRMPVGLRFLKKNAGLKTLVHCTAGASRSVAMVMAFLFKQREYGTTEELEALFKEVQLSRACAYPSQAFVDCIAYKYEITAPEIGW
jgi:protein-tyrosine phosphatase